MCPVSSVLPSRGRHTFAEAPSPTAGELATRHLDEALWDAPRFWGAPAPPPKSVRLPFVG